MCIIPLVGASPAAEGVSSSKVRDALAAGRMDQVVSMLGRPYCLVAVLTHNQLPEACATLRYVHGWWCTNGTCTTTQDTAGKPVQPASRFWNVPCSAVGGPTV